MSGKKDQARVVREACHRFGTDYVVVEHRLGVLALEEARVGIAVAHQRRAQAYETSRFIIEELTKRVPIWKLEHYVDGTREWVGAGGVDANR